MGLSKINHFSHQHPLILKNPQEPYQCGGCKEIGFNWCYECEHKGCNFSLHEECANAPQSAYHPFLKGCNLKFHKKAPQCGERFCDACGKDILGFVYQCNHKHPCDLHPCCLKLQLQRSSTKDGVTIRLKKKLPSKSKCQKCGTKEIAKGVTGWCYVSSCGNYCYHVSCVTDALWEGWKWQQDQNKTEDTTDCLALQRLNTSQEVAKQSKSSSNARKLWKMAKTVIMVIISAVFGDPTTLILSLVQYFSND